MMKTFLKYMLLFSYFTVGFFLLGLAIKILIGFIYMGDFFLPSEEITGNLIKSIIAASSITSAAIIFNLIDKFKPRKSPPSDP